MTFINENNNNFLYRLTYSFVFSAVYTLCTNVYYYKMIFDFSMDIYIKSIILSFIYAFTMYYGLSMCKYIGKILIFIISSKFIYPMWHFPCAIFIFYRHCQGNFIMCSSLCCSCFTYASLWYCHFILLILWYDNHSESFLIRFLKFLPNQFVHSHIRQYLQNARCPNQSAHYLDKILNPH